MSYDYDAVEKTVNLLVEKAKEVGPAGEVLLDETLQYISLKATVTLGLSSALLMAFLYAMYRLGAYAAKHWDEVFAHPGYFFGTTILGVAICIAAANATAQIARIFHPMGYLIRGWIGIN